VASQKLHDRTARLRRFFPKQHVHTPILRFELCTGNVLGHILAHKGIVGSSIGASDNGQRWRCDGKLARMRISGLLDNAAAIASFGSPLEPLQRIVYA